MEHPFEIGMTPLLSITPETKIEAMITNVVYSETDGYHYDFQAQFSDGQNQASVIITDVHQSLVTKE